MDEPSDAFLKAVLSRTRVVAVVGASANPARPSHMVARYLAARGCRVIPVNPGLAGQMLLGETVRAGLAECPADVDMIDIFRQSDHVPPLVEAAITHLPALRTVWMQIGVMHPEAAARARAHGLDVIENRCPKIEFERLLPA